MWDVFISHAWEDKESVARPLAEALIKAGLEVWYDEYTLTLGDSLRKSIDHGLSHSKYGVVILSPSFFEKKWTEFELSALITRETSTEKVILPIWHQISRDEIKLHSPLLADRIGVSTTLGLEVIVREILKAMEPTRTPDDARLELLLKDAYKAYDFKDYVRAKKLVRECLELEPENYKARYLQQLIYMSSYVKTDFHANDVR